MPSSSDLSILAWVRASSVFIRRHWENANPEEPVFSMDVNMELLAINPLAETLRICTEKPDAVCQIIAYSTFNDKKSIMDMEKVLHRAKFFRIIPLWKIWLLY